MDNKAQKTVQIVQISGVSHYYDLVSHYFALQLPWQQRQVLTVSSRSIGTFGKDAKKMVSLTLFTCTKMWGKSSSQEYQIKNTIANSRANSKQNRKIRKTKSEAFFQSDFIQLNKYVMFSKDLHLPF